MADRKKVLVTGISGLIGGIMCERLSAEYELSGIDRAPLGDFPVVVADIADLDAIRPAFEGIDAVVHLAADPSPRADWDSVLRNNIVGTRNVFEAARLAGVPRIVYASSHHAAGAFGLREEAYQSVFTGSRTNARPPALATDVVRPDSDYGAAKSFGESLGSSYHDLYGLSVIALRIGWVLRGDDPKVSPAALSIWLSHRDACQLIRKAVDAPPEVGFAIVAGQSRNALGFADLEPGREILGYEPEDDAGTSWNDDTEPPPWL